MPWLRIPTWRPPRMTDWMCARHVSRMVRRILVTRGCESVAMLERGPSGFSKVRTSTELACIAAAAPLPSWTAANMPKNVSTRYSQRLFTHRALIHFSSARYPTPLVRSDPGCKHEEPVGASVVSCGNTSKMLDAAKEAFDQIARAVQRTRLSDARARDPQPLTLVAAAHRQNSAGNVRSFV
jgi:hypothetical protein